MTNLLCLHELARGFYPLLVQSVCVFVALSYNTIFNVCCQHVYFYSFLSHFLVYSYDWYSELVQLKLYIETSVGKSPEAEYGVPLPLVRVGVSRLEEKLVLVEKERFSK